MFKIRDLFPHKFPTVESVLILTRRDLINIEERDLCTYRNDFIRFNVNLYCFSELENIHNNYRQNSTVQFSQSQTCDSA